jgi:hypothetical protein
VGVICIYLCNRRALQATAKLKAAEEAGSAAERDAAAREALAGLLRVPQCVNLSQMIGRLAFLRQYEVRGAACSRVCTAGRCGLLLLSAALRAALALALEMHDAGSKCSQPAARLHLAASRGA